MTDPADNPSARRPRRRWQFGLRGLLFLVLLIAVGLLACREYLKPYWRQQQTLALVEKLGGSCQTTGAGHWWLRLAGSAQNVSQVNLADCDDADAYVADVAELPAIELLIVGGPGFTDEHAKRLHALRALRGLILDSTSVSDDGLAALREALSDAEVYVSQRRAIAALRKLGIVNLFPRGAASPLRQVAGAEWFEEAELFSPKANSLDDTHAAHLRMLTQLRTLNLNGTNMTDAGMKNLQRLSQLQYLGLCGTQVTDEGLAHLHGLSQLRTLNLSHTRVTKAGIANLAQELPNCRRIVGP